MVEATPQILTSRQPLSSDANQSQAITRLEPQQRKDPDNGGKVVYDGNTMRSAEATNFNKLVNKMSLTIPPDATVSVTLTMADSSTRTITFKNIDPLESMKARLYVNQRTGQCGVVEKDLASPDLKSPLDPDFFTKRKVTRFDNKDRELIFEGDKINGFSTQGGSDAQKQVQMPEPINPDDLQDSLHADVKQNKTKQKND